MTGPLANVNGTLVPQEGASVALLDHGLLYGDGLFETIRVYGGRFFRLEAHLLRLERSAAQIELSLPENTETLAQALQETVRANELSDGVLRLTVTRGEGPPIPDPTLCKSANYYITIRPFKTTPSDEITAGLSVCRAGNHPQTWIPAIKSLSYLSFQEARSRARKRGYDDGILVNGPLLVEASSSNLFVVVDGELVTPGLDSGCLPGVARAVVLELAQTAGIPCREGKVSSEMLETAEEGFLTNSVTQIVPISRFENREIKAGKPGVITSDLIKYFRDTVEREAKL